MLRQRTNGFILPSLLNVNQTSQALDAMEKSGRIVCMCHANPDGDAVGSLLGLVSILQKKYPEKNILPI